MRRESTTTYLRPRNNWSSRLFRGKRSWRPFCWDFQDVILIDYLQKARIIRRQYYSELLGRFDAVLKEERSRFQKMLFHHQFIHLAFSSPNWMTYATNPATVSSSQTWKKCWKERDLPQNRKSFQLHNAIRAVRVQYLKVDPQNIALTSRIPISFPSLQSLW